MSDQTVNEPLNEEDQPSDAAAGDSSERAASESAASAEPAASAESAAPAPTSESLEALRQEKDALQERLLRTAAEFDNYRKRVDRERRDLADYIGAEVLTGLLPIVDNLERALQAPVGADIDGFRKGVEMIHAQMLDLLRKRGVAPLETLGADFDPNLHEAVIHETSPDHREGEIIAELQRGYRVGDRLLRPAMVKVAKSS